LAFASLVWLVSLSFWISPADVSSGFYPGLMCKGISGVIQALYDLTLYSSIFPDILICEQSVPQPQLQLNPEWGTNSVTRITGSTSCLEKYIQKSKLDKSSHFF
jgi:hypothetical protein